MRRDFTSYLSKRLWVLSQAKISLQDANNNHLKLENNMKEIQQIYRVVRMVIKNKIERDCSYVILKTFGQPFPSFLNQVQIKNDPLYFFLFFILYFITFLPFPYWSYINYKKKDYSNFKENTN